VLFPCIVHSQETKKQTDPAKFSIGFNFSPDFCYRSLHNKEGGEGGDAVIKSRNSIEIEKFGYTTGLNINYTHSKRILFETGIQYSNKGYKTKNVALDPGSPTPDPAMPVRAQGIYSYQYIGIPLRAKFIFGRGPIIMPIKKRKLGSDKFYMFLSAGFMTNFLVNTRQVIIFEYADGRKTENKTASTKDFNKIDISILAGMGSGYNISKKILLTWDPTFRFGLITPKDSPIRERLWNIGVNFGIHYSLH
jgi:hypothetical protein